MGKLRLIWSILSCLLLLACNGPDAPLDSTPALTPSTELDKAAPSTFKLASPAFAEGGAIPLRHSCDGEDLSPALRWTDPPAGTESFALICSDPDAPGGDWVHWVVFNIPPAARELAEGITSDDDLPAGSIQGRNSWKRSDYGGPCPPAGTHRYVFHLYALDAQLPPGSETTKEQLLRAIQSHSLAEAELMGTFAR